MDGYIYRTTNHVNGKQYIGMHSYEGTPNEKYLGSGVVLKRAFRKYGKQNFSREILEEFTNTTLEELFEAERRWIAKLDACYSDSFYNRNAGGRGSCTDSMKKYWAQFTPEERKTMRNWDRSSKQTMLGKKHSAETKRRIGSKSVGRNWGRKTPVTGQNNPMFGRSAVREQNLRWFTNGTETRYISANGPIPNGFYPGRAKKSPNIP